MAPDGPGGVSTLQPIASTRHTIVLLTILTIVSVAGFRANTPGASPNRPLLYVSVIVGELLLLRYVVIGLRARPSAVPPFTLLDLLGERTIIDVFLAAAFWAATRLLLLWLRHTIGSLDNHAAPILPSGVLEMMMWVAVSITAGVVEEFVFRGYLQTQFAAWSHNVMIGIVLQAVVFGASHGYQGLQSMALITILGTLYGLLAWWRRSLVPGILAHAWTDIFGGISG